MSWILSAYAAVPEDKRESFLKNLNPDVFKESAFETLEYEHERLKRQYEESCARIECIKRIKTHMVSHDEPPPSPPPQLPAPPPQLKPTSDQDIAILMTKALSPVRVGDIPDGFIFKSIGDVLKHRKKNDCPFFYYHNEPNVTPECPTVEKLTQVFNATYGMKLACKGHLKSGALRFTVNDGHSDYFNIIVRPDGVKLGLDWCNANDVLRFSEPFHT